ncbi:2,3-bisphosphoglycerate-dependent phosphoglycerate [Musa troglodytarum]|uniref:phosphoglycerate mutase (2,3-diphosphoglycerate-dependent) n=1 Tax=Musa troglodytarum TaxID=320322 RepID=A0A9E7L523_9LILI|nr:2,3-bisphosphoglycerate-dependent phosphoglycerate [Musa troglodytarum]
MCDGIRRHLNEASLILIRHGESLWNEKNLFPRCVDVPLTQKGVEEAIEAGMVNYKVSISKKQLPALEKRRLLPPILEELFLVGDGINFNLHSFMIS